jgi:hypothetical protein
VVAAIGRPAEAETGLTGRGSRADVTRYLYFGPNDEAASREALARKRARVALREPGDVLNLAIVVRATASWSATCY